ncbi:hypothetical protein OFT50_12975 [Brachyspira hyodysenteriae]|nr:hypothetical protein [Brachyspira hyodysenteriae]MDA0072976.1 hypothetical protein [Brachyspira hyodysenteriae]
MAELKNNIFNNNIAGDTSNILIPDTSAIKSGVVFKANIDSNVLNGYYNLLSGSSTVFTIYRRTLQRRSRL